MLSSTCLASFRNCSNAPPLPAFTFRGSECLLVFFSSETPSNGFSVPEWASEERVPDDSTLLPAPLHAEGAQSRRPVWAGDWPCAQVSHQEMQQVPLDGCKVSYLSEFSLPEFLGETPSVATAEDSNMRPVCLLGPPKPRTLNFMQSHSYEWERRGRVKVARRDIASELTHLGQSGEQRPCRSPARICDSWPVIHQDAWLFPRSPHWSHSPREREVEHQASRTSYFFLFHPEEKTPSPGKTMSLVNWRTQVFRAACETASGRSSQKLLQTQPLRWSLYTDTWRIKTMQQRCYESIALVKRDLKSWTFSGSKMSGHRSDGLGLITEEMVDLPMSSTIVHGSTSRSLQV